jgi:hypothetical protein
MAIRIGAGAGVHFRGSTKRAARWCALQQSRRNLDSAGPCAARHLNCSAMRRSLSHKARLSHAAPCAASMPPALGELVAAIAASKDSVSGAGTGSQARAASRRLRKQVRPLHGVVGSQSDCTSSHTASPTAAVSSTRSRARRGTRRAIKSSANQGRQLRCMNFPGLIVLWQPGCRAGRLLAQRARSCVGPRRRRRRPRKRRGSFLAAGHGRGARRLLSTDGAARHVSGSWAATHLVA